VISPPWPERLAAGSQIAQAQQQGSMRRVGVLTGGPNDERFQSDLAAFQNALRDLGWVEGRNIALAVHAGNNSAERLAAEVKDLVRSRPDIILAGPSNALRPLSQETTTIPIVFVRVSNPVGQGFVKTLARPKATSPASATWNSRSPGNGCKRSRKWCPGQGVLG
jgi:putative tryptophan/tyrosine transport system substrate-binding protein